MLCTLSASLLPFISGPAFAAGVLPTGGNFTAGSGKISNSASTLTVNQTTKSGIINWSGFSIGQGNSVRIDNGSGATLNRVTGTSPSSIAGSLTSTGSAYLVNQNGIVVTPSGRIITGGSFVATTRDTSNGAFMRGGNLEFTGNSPGTVTNQGTISAAGDAVLIGKSATNSGTIAAPNGTAGVVAGDGVVLQPSGSGLQIEVTTGSGNATTSGNIAAAQALIDAAGGNAYALAGNNGAVVRATGTATVGGHVWLTAGGTVNVASTVTARNADASGGAIDVQGNTIKVSGTLNANDVAPIGNGGSITVGSPAVALTSVSGTLEARGGPKGGNGGAVETSGKLLNTGGIKIDASAPQGTAGNWTLDPYDLTVDAAAASTIDSTLNGGTGVTLKTTATGASGPGNQNSSGNGDIIIDSPINWSSTAALNLSAYRDIDVNANVAVAGGGKLSLTTGTAGDYIIAAGSSISFPGGSSSGASLTINGAAYTLLYSVGAVQNINASGAALSGNYALATSLDASGVSNWIPIGTDGNGTVSGNGFSGIFDGLGNIISKLSINLPFASDVGLFGYSSGTIRNLGMVGGSVSGGSSGNFVGAFVGGLVGQNEGTISNVYATGAVNGLNQVGGLVGENDGSITNAYATGAVSVLQGGEYVGGLVGTNFSGTITNAYATGTVTGSQFVGGLVGLNGGNGGGTISNAYATGAVSGIGAVGGLAGQNYGGTISNAYATGAVTGGAADVGGLAGDNEDGQFSNAYWDTETSGKSSSAGGTGLTTAQLSTALPGGFSSSAWGNVNNQTTPYLLFSPGPVYIGNDATHLFTFISSMAQLQAINASSASLEGNYALANSLDAITDPTMPASWIPIGTDGARNVLNSGNGFSGTFDGLGHTISNLTISLPSAYHVGLFGYAGRTSTIRDIGIVEGAVSGNADVGGLVGSNYGSVTGSFSTGTVSAGNNGTIVGGLVGYNDGSIGNSHSVSAISTGFNVADVGGLVGYSEGAITQSYAAGTVTGNLGGANIGGLVGINDNSITQSYAAGAVSGGADVGGLVGYESGGTISNAYASGAVSGSSNFVGGLVGENEGGAITNAYATGAVGGTDYIGGLVGLNGSGTITNSYAAGAVSGSEYVGGLIGTNVGTIANAYWDTATSGQSTGIGTDNNNQSGNVSGLTTAQLSAAMPSGFSSSVWGNVNNQTTPYLLFNPGPVYLGSDSTHLFALITTVAQLQAINAGNASLEGNYALANSLDASGVSSWVPIGTDEVGNVANSGQGFSGIFDGLGNTISNLKISLPSANYVGLFGYSSGTIRNLGLTGGAVAGSDSVGGLVGQNEGTISNAYTTGAVSGSYFVGGLVGQDEGTMISSAYATGAVSGSEDVGGLVGISIGTIANAYATGTVRGNAEVGGLVGYKNGGTITNAYATGAVSGSYDFIGGLVGENDGAITNAYATGAVTGTDYIGGLAGFGVGTIANAYATGVINGSADVGGLVGYENGGTITNSYAAGAVSGSGGNIGGLAGQNSGSVTSSYWDTTTCSQSQCNNGYGTGLTNAQLAGQSTPPGLPSGFSSSVWGNVNNQTTPYLLSNPGPVYIGSDSTHLFTLIFTMAQLQAINASSTALQGNYALANSLDASGLSSWTPIGTNASGAGFTGIFEGFGNTISNLTISLPSAGYVGLFAESGGTIRNIGMLGGSVSGGYYVGSLVGRNVGTISNAYASGSVSGNDGVGGLVGDNAGTISNAYATGAVSGVGNYSYDVGGLVGENDATISNAYATGAVSGASGIEYVGGLVGSSGGTISSAYWDTQTTGQATSAGGIGLTTAQLQGTLPAGFSSSVWGTSAGQYPWLLLHPPPVIDVTAALTGRVIKTYDGTIYATLNEGNYTLSNGAPVDLLTVNNMPVTGPTTGEFYAGGAATANVGTGLTVKVSGLGLNQPAGDNYVLTTTTISANNIGTINPAMLTYVANPASSTYGSALPVLSGTVTGFVNGDTQPSATTGTLGFTSSANSSSNVGSYAINGSGLTANSGNYLFVQAPGNVTALTINPARLTYVANPVSSTYGSAVPALSGTVTGFVNGDTQPSATTGTTGFTSSAGSSSNVGSYAINGSGLSAGNYVFVQAPGNATALTINPAALIIYATSGSKSYDGTTSSVLVPTYTGLVQGDSLTGLSELYNSKDVTTAAYVSVSSYLLSDPGNYTVTAKTAPGSVTPAPLAVSAVSQTKSYDGTIGSTSIDPYTGAAISTVAPNITGTVYTAAGDSIVVSEAFATANAGPATLKPVVTINDGVGGADYAVTLVNASGTITRRPISLTGSRTYDGTTNASAGILTMANIVNGDTLTLSGTGVLTGNGLTNDNQTPGFASIGTLALGGASAANYTLANITTPVTVGSQLLNTVYISFSGVNLTSGTSLTGANLSGLNLTGVTLSGQNLTGTNLTGTNLTGANLSGANLKSATLDNANLSDATLSGANLMGDSLAGANLTGAKLTGSNLKGDNLAGANLTGANLSGDNLSHDDLLSAILIDTNLSGANLMDSNLTGANLTGANLTGANLHGVTQ